MYEWLKDYQKLCNEIDYLEFSLDRNETELKRWSEGDLFNVRLNENSIASGLEETIERINKEIKIKEEQRDKLIHLVNTFKGLDHKILKMKYVDGLTLESIAEELKYSAGYIYKKHAEIMRMLKFVDNFHFTNTK
ncbi:hypothetical protein GLW20_02405 [Virgibacillus halodenitrificans]|nr:hypothetical protein [Virgibacillus halodenitrificans]